MFLNLFYFGLGFMCLWLGINIIAKVLYPWLNDVPKRWWVIFASACSVLGVILVLFALVNTFGWVGTGLMIAAGALINIRQYQVMKHWDTQLQHEPTFHRSRISP